jgi:hypothetical protein
MARDLRRYARQTNARLFVGMLLLLFIVGDGLIYIIYGREAAVMGIICLATGLAPLVIIWALLTFLGWVAKKAGGD